MWRIQAQSIVILAVWLCVAQRASAEGVRVHEATREQAKAAQKTFEAADVLYDGRRYAEALSAFRASHDVVASPNARLMIARSLRELNRTAEALEEFEAALADAEAEARTNARYKETARAAREELEALRGKVAFLSVRVRGAPAGATVTVGQRSFDASVLEKPVIVDPGKMMVVASAPGRGEQRREVEIAAGDSQELEFDLGTGAASSDPVGDEELARDDPEEAKVSLGPNTSMRTWAYVAGGVGGAGLVAFGVFGALNNAKFSTLEDDCPSGRCPAGSSEDIDAGRRYQTFANIGLAVGVIGVGTGVTLFLLSQRGTKEASGQPQARLYVGAGSMLVRGRF